ncbi:MAG: DUF1367 family protein [Rubrivivax sp.]|nr:MAG: DUF1367 family protein [Rubrivivax sp.]
MPTIVVTPAQEGGLDGVSWVDKRAYARFKARLKLLQPGDTLEFSWKAPRSPEFHRRHFAVLAKVFDNQETFTDEYEFRKWGEMGAGHYTEVPGPDGVPQRIPKSIDYVSLDDDEFRELHRSVKDFIRSDRGLGTLWPHANPLAAWTAVDHLMEARR